jgi:dTDP-4-dehydrorhamnose reductase
MKVLILGADGMLGHVVKLYFQEHGHTVKVTSRSNKGDYYFDATKNINDLNGYIQEFKPDAVVNCIGILNKVAEDNKALAVLVNSYLPHYLDEICQKNGVKFVHISTDCVFDGKKGEYAEDSFKDATSFYGQSKALGEINNESNLTLRTSIVGPDVNANGAGLFQWFMNQEGKVDGFDKVIWTGVTTIELAKCIEKAIKNNLTGLRHVVNNEKIDKYSLLNLFKKHFNKDVTINRKSDYVSNKSLKRTTDFDFAIPSYDQMVKEMANWVTEHKLIYSESQRVKK